MSNTTKINSKEDVLAWNLFFEGSKKRKKSVPKLSTLDNRLIFETKNLFVVAGLGSFVPGYYLIITKSPYTSFAQLNEEEYETQCKKILIACNAYIVLAVTGRT